MQIRIPERQKRWRWAGFVLVLHVVLTAGVSEAQTSRIDALFARLQTSTGEETTQTENDIVDLWSQSGSPMTDSLFLHASRLADQRSYLMAMQLINRTLRMNPEFAEAWNLRATIHYLLRNYPASIRDIEATLELNPRHFGALNGLALILEQSGYDELALEAYDRVARLSPNRRGLRESIARVQSRILAKSH